MPFFTMCGPANTRTTLLAEIAAPGTSVVPAAGPGYGMSMDQALVLRDFDFPTVMVLPHQGLNTPDGVASGLRHFAEAYGKPIVVYIKAEGYQPHPSPPRWWKDGLVSWIKYAIVRTDETAICSSLNSPHWWIPR